ncbi:MAG TPA: hypothetical protein EYP98_17710, partial [Planctomycetes bacterium]|nr:hypothetical protein [Planctomycetota bacterium]
MPTVAFEVALTSLSRSEHLGQVSRHRRFLGYHHVHLGLNGRLDTMQAAVLLAKLDIFEDEVNRRQVVA